MSKIGPRSQNQISLVQIFFQLAARAYYLSACAYCAVRVGYAHRSGKSTANSQQACREAVLVLGHRSGRARRTEATVRIRLEKSRLERWYRVEFAKPGPSDRQRCGWVPAGTC